MQLHPKTLSFLRQLKKNNNKVWFEQHRTEYEQIRTSVLQCTKYLLIRLSALNPALKYVEPSQCVFRIHRDIRFTADKSPYKTHIGIAIGPKGRQTKGPVFYVHIEAGNSFVGGGCWMPDPVQLTKIRQEIDYRYHDFLTIINSKSFRKTFGNLDQSFRLRKAPKDYDAHHPAIEFLKLKSFTCSALVTDRLLTSNAFLPTVVRLYHRMQPLLHFLDEATTEDSSP